MVDLKTVVAEHFKVPVERAAIAILHHSCRVTPPGKWPFMTSDPDMEVMPGTLIEVPTTGSNVTIEVK